MKFSKIFSIILIVIGVISVFLGLFSYTDENALYAGSYEWYGTYGGDAYTGIQNAAAQTSNNVLSTNKILKFGFGSVLLITGLLSAVVGANKLLGDTEIGKLIGNKLNVQSNEVESKVDNAQTTETTNFLNKK